MESERMPTYTVHAPPANKGEIKPERFVFVRDGFHAWAFIAPEVWLLAYRQWLALLLFLVSAGAVVDTLAWLGVGTAAVVAAGLCISLLVGFEAATIRRWTFARRGWAMLGFVVGDDLEEAERRFFARWAERPQPVQAAAQTPVPPSAPPRRTSQSGVIGLFPEPGGAR
jgi:hypothetical protein